MSQMYACNGSMTAHGCAGLSSLPLFLVLNPLSIASLGRVVTGLNRCSAFRIQQQVLHSDAGNFFRSFLWYLLSFSSRNIGLYIRQGASFHFRAIKLNVSLSVCVALNRYIKIRKFFEDSKSAQIPISGRLVSYCVYDAGVSIAATGVTLEHSIGIGVSVGYVPAHRLCPHRSLSRLRNQAHTFGVVR